MPCKFTKCNKNAKCVNSRAFTAQCICNFGYSGNGKTKCDGKKMLLFFFLELSNFSTFFVFPTECGLRTKQPNLRIIGGAESVEESWPESALVIFSFSAKVQDKGETFTINYSSFCGGTLINHKHVLTAAHCIPTRIEHRRNAGYTIEVPVITNSVYPTYESMLKVYLGVYNKSSILKSTLNNEYSVEKLIKVFIKINYVVFFFNRDVYFLKHENYNARTLFNDIAILKLSRIVELNDKIQVACLPELNTKSYPLPLNEAWIIGWGQTEFGGPSNNLKNAKIKIYAQDQCSNVSFSLPKSWETQICAGDKINKIDTCQGDSGGGLFVQEMVNNKKIFVMSGITSYGDGCAQPDKPG